METGDVVPMEVISEVGVSENVFLLRMDSLENLILCELFCSAVMVGCLIALIVLRFFHVR